MGRGPERRTQWIVSTLTPAQDATLTVPVGPPAAAPTELEQQLAASIRMVEQCKQAQQAPAAAPAWAQFLVAQSNALVDCHSQVLIHAAKYPNVRGEDVRSNFLSTFINVSKGRTAVSPRITFELGEPVVATLRFPRGLEIPSKYYERWPGGTTQYLFSAVEGNFYLPEGAGALLNARLRSRGIAAGETITITMVKIANPNAPRPVTEYIPLRCDQEGIEHRARLDEPD